MYMAFGEPFKNVGEIQRVLFDALAADAEKGGRNRTQSAETGAFCTQVMRFLGDATGDLFAWAQTNACMAAGSVAGDRRWLYNSIDSRHHAALDRLCDSAPDGFDVDDYVRFLAMNLFRTALTEPTMWPARQAPHQKRSGNGRLLAGPRRRRARQK